MSASEEYHVVSRNSPASLFMKSSYRVHYLPEVQQLQVSAPLRIYGSTEPLSDKSILLGSLDLALQNRRSSRDFCSEAILSREELSTILIRSYGATDGAAFGLAYRRPIPTSGNLGSPEIFFVVRHVEGLDPGIYHFESSARRVALLRQGEFTEWLRLSVLFQPEHADASVIMFLTSNVGRLRAKYGERGYRLGLLDVGHLSQLIYLIAAGLGKKVCATAGFVDREIDEALNLDGIDHATFLAVCIGS